MGPQGDTRWFGAAALLAATLLVVTCAAETNESAAATRLSIKQSSSGCSLLVSLDSATSSEPHAVDCAGPGGLVKLWLRHGSLSAVPMPLVALDAEHGGAQQTIRCWSSTTVEHAVVAPSHAHCHREWLRYAGVRPAQTAAFYEEVAVANIGMRLIYAGDDETLGDAALRFCADLPESSCFAVALQYLQAGVARQVDGRLFIAAELTALKARGLPVKVSLGAGHEQERADRVRTDIPAVNAVRSSDFAAVFGPHRSVDEFFAEHVWEHLDLMGGIVAAANCFQWLKPTGRLVVAVPDANRPLSPADCGKAMNCSAFAAARHHAEVRDGHAVQYSLQTLEKLLKLAGFQQVQVLEAHNILGHGWTTVHSAAQDVSRSAEKDPRGPVSLIVVAYKTGSDTTSSRAALLEDPYGEWALRQELVHATYRHALVVPSVDSVVWPLPNGPPSTGSLRALVQTARAQSMACHWTRDYADVNCNDGMLPVTAVVHTQLFSQADYTATSSPLATALSGTAPRRAGWQVGGNYLQPVAQRLCILTLVINGMDFLPKQERIMSELTGVLDWSWHIVEGIAEGRANASDPYSQQPLHGFADEHGLSTDGSSEFLDALAARHGHRVRIFRPQAGKYWRDKLHMSNEGLKGWNTPCILLQLDVDEIWSPIQLQIAVRMFDEMPAYQCAYFHCHYFVTPELVTATLNTYSHNRHTEWLRMWRYDPSQVWFRHAPPFLGVPKRGVGWQILRDERCIPHEVTQRWGLVFSHHAYTSASQVAFKAAFYGYPRALIGWERLRLTAAAPGNEAQEYQLNKWLPWISDSTLAVHYSRARIGAHVPVLSSSVSIQPPSLFRHGGVVVLDLVIFQLQAQLAGIRRVWQELLPHLFRQKADGVRLVLLFRTTIGAALPVVEALLPSLAMLQDVIVRRIPPLQMNDISNDVRMADGSLGHTDPCFVVAGDHVEQDLSITWSNVIPIDVVHICARHSIHSGVARYDTSVSLV